MEQRDPRILEILIGHVNDFMIQESKKNNLFNSTEQLLNYYHTFNSDLEFTEALAKLYEINLDTPANR